MQLFFGFNENRTLREPCPLWPGTTDFVRSLVKHDVHANQYLLMARPRLVCEHSQTKPQWYEQKKEWLADWRLT